MIRYVTGGFFVGFGTKLSNGCTSGHGTPSKSDFCIHSLILGVSGICGMTRLSVRSLAATVTFFGTAVAVATGLNL